MGFFDDFKNFLGGTANNVNTFFNGKTERVYKPATLVGNSLTNAANAGQSNANAIAGKSISDALSQAMSAVSTGGIKGINNAGYSGDSTGGKYVDPYEDKIDQATATLMRMKYPEYNVKLDTSAIDKSYSAADKNLAGALASALKTIENGRSDTTKAYGEGRAQMKGVNASSKKEIAKNVTGTTKTFNDSTTGASKTAFESISNAIKDQRASAVADAIAAAKTSGGKADLTAVNKMYDQRLADAQTDYNNRQNIDSAEIAGRSDDAKHAQQMVQQNSDNNLDDLSAALAAANASYDQRSVDTENNYGQLRANMNTQKGQALLAAQQAANQAGYQAQTANYTNQQSALLQALQGLQGAQQEGLKGYNDQQSAKASADQKAQQQLYQFQLEQMKEKSAAALAQTKAKSGNNRTVQQQAILNLLSNNAYKGDYGELLAALGN